MTAWTMSQIEIVLGDVFCQIPAARKRLFQEVSCRRIASIGCCQRAALTQGEVAVISSFRF